MIIKKNKQTNTIQQNKKQAHDTAYSNDLFIWIYWIIAFNEKK